MPNSHTYNEAVDTFFSSRMRSRLCCFVKTGWDMSLCLRYTCKYHYFYIDLTFETNRLPESNQVSKLLQKKLMIRNREKTPTWLLRLAVFQYVTSIIKTVYRVQNCSPQKVMNRFLWESNFKSTFTTKFEYSKNISWLYLRLGTYSWSLRTHSLI